MAPLAYHTRGVHARLPLHSIRRQPRGQQMASVCQFMVGVFSFWPLAWRFLEFCHVGGFPRVFSDSRQAFFIEVFRKNRKGACSAFHLFYRGDGLGAFQN